MSNKQTVTSSRKGHEFVIIETSDGANECQVSKAALVKSSEYFRAALQGDFEEAKTRRIKIPGSDPKDVQMLVNYLNNRGLPKYAKEVKAMEAGDMEAEPREPEAIAFSQKQEAVTERYKSLADLYMLAEYVLMPTLQDRIVEETVAIMQRSYLPVEAIKYCYGQAHGMELGHTFVTQARHELFHTSNISYTELAELAQVANFMSDFIEDVVLAIGDSRHEFLPAWGSLKESDSESPE